MLRQTVSAMTLITLFLAACAPLPTPLPPTDTALLSPLASPTAVAKPTRSPGAEAATGVVYSTAGGDRRPMANTVVRLARVVWNQDKSDGAFVLEGGTSPTATTDDSGRFSFQSVSPGDYVIVVGDVYAKHEIVSAPDGKAQIYTVPAEGQAPWGDIVVSLAP